jgi:Glycosyl hydrolase family 9.
MMLLYDITKTLDPDTSARALGLAKNQVDYCMGTNEFNRSFIHGFGPNSWDKVHHRNIQGNDDNLPDAQKETTPFKFKRSGALIGGPTAVNTFNNSVVDYTCTESGCDYNAGIAGALAGLISINAPYAVPVKNPGPEEQRVLPAAGSLAVAPLVSVGNRRVRIDYALKETGRCSVTILNARAQVIAAVAGGVATAGAHRAVWDASQAGPGPYFCDLTIGSYSIVRKILLTK